MSTTTMSWHEYGHFIAANYSKTTVGRGALYFL